MKLRFAGALLLALLNAASVLEEARFAVATGFDPGGLLGVAMLAR